MKIIGTKTCDIAVVGGGVAGAAAALEAVRSGKKVILVEKTTQLGGLGTIGLINFFEPVDNARGVQIMKGMVDEFLRLCVRHGYDTIPEMWQNGDPGLDETKRRFQTGYSAAIFSLALCDLLADEGVEIMFDTVMTDADATDGHIDSITVFNKSGHSLIKANMFVDASGDADLLAMAGVPTVTGGNYDSYFAHGVTLESLQNAINEGNIGKRGASGFAGGCVGLYGTGHPEDMPLWDGTDGEDVSRYFIKNQRQLFNRIKDQDRMTRDITCLPIMPQFRTTRRIDGNYTLTTEDAYKHFEDSVGTVVDFNHRYFLYEMPYGVLVRNGFDNVIAAGRITSGSGYGWDILRVIPPAILSGHAAGAATAQAIDTEKAITDIDISVLQARLANEGVAIHFDEALAPEDRTLLEKFKLGH
ncbi:MAG: FAD-dependent oxidoreductase [Clostridia bacterium]|nr:FAD-dependent oxidoreductase [Clostridia bacterium]